MLTYILNVARDLGFHYIEEHVFAHNATSLSLHQKAGFSIVGIQREIANLDGKWADNVILSRIL